MKCPRCKAEIPTGSRFCKECGALLRREPLSMIQKQGAAERNLQEPPRERRVVREEVEYSSGDLKCPRCGQSDMVQKVSAIHSSGLVKSRGVGVGGAISSGASVVPAMAGFRSESQSEISSQLSPPAKPVRQVGFLVVLILIILATSFLNPLVPSIYCGASSLVTILLIIIAIILLEKRYATKQRKWKKAMKGWNELYYCFRDDGVFNPRRGKFIPLSKMNSYLYQQP